MPKSKVRKSKKKRESEQSRKARQRSRMLNLLVRESARALKEDEHA